MDVRGKEQRNWELEANLELERGACTVAPGLELPGRCLSRSPTVSTLSEKAWIRDPQQCVSSGHWAKRRWGRECGERRELGQVEV